MVNKNTSADALARALLMPEDNICKYMCSNRDVILKNISDVFGVPKDQVKMRLIDLGYEEYTITTTETIELPGYHKKN